MKINTNVSETKRGLFNTVHVCVAALSLAACSAGELPSELRQEKTDEFEIPAELQPPITAVVSVNGEEAAIVHHSPEFLLAAANGVSNTESSLEISPTAESSVEFSQTTTTQIDYSEQLEEAQPPIVETLEAATDESNSELTEETIGTVVNTQNESLEESSFELAQEGVGITTSQQPESEVNNIEPLEESEESTVNATSEVENQISIAKSITMRWSAADIHDLGYSIYYSTDNGQTYQLVKQLYIEETTQNFEAELTLSSVDDLYLLNESSVCFTVAAWSAFGESAHSTPECIMI